MVSKTQRFSGDITPNVDDYDSEYARIAKWLDDFLPKEDLKTYDVELSDNNKATYESVEVIRKLVEEGKKDPIIRTLSEKIVQYLPPKDYKREVDAIYNFVIRRLRYTKDIHRVETVHTARQLLSRHRKAADCDDFVILTGALLQAIGHPVRIIIIGNNYDDKEDYSHIYLQVFVDKKWTSLDGSVPGAKVGWEAPKYATKKIISLDGELMQTTSQSMIPTYAMILLLIICVYFLVK